VGPLHLHDWAGDGDVVDTSVVVPLLSLCVEVDAGPPSDHVNNSAIRLISEVFLLWCLGVILGGGCLADAGAEAGAEVVRFVPPGGVGMRG
jgi:hypothetical protein